MGQVNATASPHSFVQPFVNLPKEAILSLWLSYNLLGEGWALTQDQFVSIFQEATFIKDKYRFGITELGHLFTSFDTDANGLVDALEILVTIGLLSAMDALDKVNFAFSAFDFEGKGSLSRDETNLLFRSLIKGLQKVSPAMPGFSEASSNDASKFADLVFDAAGREKWYGRVSADEFTSYSVAHPVVGSWLRSVAAFDEKDRVERVAEAEVKDPQAKSEWIAALNGIFSADCGRRAARHTLAMEDILLELQTENEQVADDEEQPWMQKVALLKPEEVPPQRTDLPEDAIESAWVVGINTRRIAGSASASFAEAFIHRAARYRTEDSDALVFAAASNVIAMKKNEESLQWAQELGNAHDTAISAFDVHYGKDLLVTADSSSQLVLWKLSTLTVKRRLSTPHGVRFLDLNANGSLVLVIYEDPLSTLAVISLDSGLTVFSKQLLLDNALGDRITDARFFGSSAMFAISSTKLGLRFFVNEETGLMGKDNMQLYEERAPLFDLLGTDVKTSSVLCLTRLDALDEMVCGTSSGHIILWRGRTAVQAVSVHQGPVLALDFQSSATTLVSGGMDGQVAIFEISTSGGEPTKKGPKPVPIRQLQCTATFNILSHSMLNHSIGSLALSKDASKLLVVTCSNNLLEVRCKIAPPTAEELEAAAEVEEGGVAASKGSLGDDLHGGPIMSCHYLSAESIAEGLPIVASACRLPAGGFATCGSDRAVRIWQAVGDAEGGGAFKTVSSIPLDCPSSAVAATSSLLAVALASANSPRNGAIQLFALPDATVAAEISCGASVRSLLISAEGNLIAAATDDKVCVFALAEGNWTVKGTLPTQPTCMDLSSDNQFLRCFNNQSHDMQVFDIAASFGKEMFGSINDLVSNAPKAAPVLNDDGEEVDDGSAAVNPAAALIDALKNATWSSQNCPYGFDTGGVKALKGSARLFDRSNTILLSAMDSGRIAVSRVPASSATARAVTRTVTTHVGPLNALLFFEEGGAKVATVGALDGIVRVWKVAYDTDEPEVDLPDPVTEEGDAPPPAEEEEGKVALPKLYDSGEEDDLLDIAQMKKHLKLVVPEAKARADDDELASAHLPAVLSGFAKSLGFPNTIELVQASCRMYNTERTPVPTDELKLAWIYGCSSRQTRNAVRYTAEGTITYPAGTVGVVFDKNAKTQKHVFPHKDEITCLDVHSGRKIAATAHKGVGSIHAFIWKTLDGQVLRSLDCGTCNGISALRFSPDGSLLLVACQDADHTLKMFSVEDGSLLGSVIGGDKKVLCLTFSDIPSGGAWRILQGGVKHFRIISFNIAARTMTYKTGGYGADVRKSHVNCCSALPLVIGEDGTASGNEFVLGMSDGTLAFLARGESKVGGFVPGFTGPVTAVYAAKVKEATAEEPALIKVVAAGTNGVIKVLDQDLQPLSEWNLYAKDYGLHELGRVRGFKSICCDKLNRKILYSTSAGEIGEIDFTSGEDINAGPVVSGHFRDRLSAVASHPIRQECLTAGEDKTLRVWDLETHTVIAMIELPGAAVCAAFAPNGHLIVVGLGRKEDEEMCGRMAIVSYLQGKLRIVHVASEARDILSSLVFSPDGSKVFAASLDKVIYVYDALNNFVLVTTMVGHNAGVRLLDIAQNSRYLLSQSVKDDVMVWDLSSFTSVARARDRFEALADVESHWATRQGFLSLNSMGIFPADAPADDLLSLAQSRDAKLLAVGDQKGLLHLFACPSVQCYAPCKNFALHSAGGLSAVSFTVDDHYLLTAGAHDKMLAQWRVVKGGESGDVPTTVTKAVDLPPPDDIYENSFVVKGVDFRNDAVEASPLSLSAQLTNVLGVGNSSNRALPAALFCGHGEIVTTFGKTVAALEDGKKMRLWNYNAVRSVGSAEASHGDVSCIAASVSGRYVLVGHKGDAAPLLLYRAPTGVLAVELATVAGGVTAAGMGLNDRTIACIGGDSHSSLHVFKTFSGDWDDCLLIYRGQISDGAVSLLSFSNTLSTIGQEYAAADLVTAGAAKIRFWRIDGLNVLSTLGNYGSEAAAEVTALCRGAMAQITVSGDVLGRLLQWDGNYASTLETFSSPITALTAFGASGSGKTGLVVATAAELRVMLCHGATAWTTPWSLSLADMIASMDFTSGLYSSGFLGRGTVPVHLAADPACKQVLISMSCGALLSLATDSLSVRRLAEGHCSGAAIVAVLAMPHDANTLLTFCADGAVRVWDISGASVVSGIALAGQQVAKASTSCMIAYSLLAHTPTAAIFLNDHILLVAVRDADASSNSAAILVVRIGVTLPSRRPELVVVHRLHNIGRGPLHHLRLSPDKRLLTACSEDGCVYVYEMLPLPEGDSSGSGSEGEVIPSVCVVNPLGFLLAHPTGSAVCSADFSLDSRFVRTFAMNNARHNGKVETNYFDFSLSSSSAAAAGAAEGGKVRRHAAGKVQDVGALEELKAAQWATIGSAVAPEARGLAFPADSADQSLPMHVHSVSASADLICGGYDDGSVRVFRSPAPSKQLSSEHALLKLSAHSAGPVSVAFVPAAHAQQQCQRLVTVGQTDGCLMVWTLAA